MFAILPTPALTDRRLLASDLRVLGAIRTFTRPDRPTCWPSRKAIGSRCGITSESRISKVLGRLESLGWIQITRRQGSSVYHVFDAPQVSPEQPCTPVCIPAVHTSVQLEEIREETNYLPPFPPLDIEADPVTVTPIQPELIHCNVSLDEAETANGEPIAVEQLGNRAAGQSSSWAVEQLGSWKEEDGQGEPVETTAHREATEPPESAPTPTPDRKPKPDPEQRHKATQAVLARLEQITGIKYAGRATERKIARRIDCYGLAMILAVITAKAQDFQHPLCLLRPSTLEAAIAELERDNQKRLEAARDDQKRLEEIKASNRPTGDKAVGLAALAAMKRLLGPSKRPLTDTMRA